MPVTTSQIADIIARYLDQHPDERPGLQPLLTELEAGTDLASRSSLPGHVTSGAAVIDGRGLALLIRHRTLGRWLLPGGHLDPGDETLPAAALRELREETGIGSRGVDQLASGLLPLDIDIHAIPANPAKGEPAHWHADFRYAFRAGRLKVTPQLEEVSGYAWLPPARLDSRRLAARLTKLADAPNLGWESAGQL
jgi:8-oxo-dGTP pyrophosphatase MutT (NUDIX family)